jgi:undecaprenyl-diphosphatase
MTENILAALMGVVEGVTEFLPVSSTGHLILAGSLLGFDQTVGKEVADCFKVVIQIGAILAIVVAFPRRFTGLLDLRASAGFRGWRGIGLLVLTTLPAVVIGAPGDHYIKKYLFNEVTVAIGLAVGAIWIAVVESSRLRPRTEGLDAVTWKEALLVGFYQCLAMWPGVSRSGATILGGMLSGLDRKTATEYSFFAALPVLFAAGIYDLYKSLPYLSTADIPLFAIGLVVSFVFALLAVKGFVHFLARHTLVPFAWYRIALAVLVILWFVVGGHSAVK